MNLGAEPKKVAILAGLGIVAAYMLYTNVLSGPGPDPRASKSAPVAAAAPRSAAPPAAEVGAPSLTGVRGRSASVRRNVGTPRIQEFRPSLLPAKGEEPDLATIDPTLRLELLRRVQSVSLDGGGRNVFQFSTAPPPPALTASAPKIVPKTPQQVAQEMAEQSQSRPGEAQKPPAPPINLKFYGYANPSPEGTRRAFLQEGDNIFVAEEGQVVNKRYRVVRIRTSSVEVEDTQFHNTQTLPLTPPPQHGVG